MLHVGKVPAISRKHHKRIFRTQPQLPAVVGEGKDSSTAIKVDAVVIPMSEKNDYFIADIAVVTPDDGNGDDSGNEETNSGDVTDTTDVTDKTEDTKNNDATERNDTV